VTRQSDTNASTPVLLVSPSATAGGAERAFAGLARTLPATGFHPIAALLQRGPLEDWLREAGCETHVLPSHRTRNVARTVRTVGSLRRLARSTGARVVVSNMSKGHFFGSSAASVGHLPGSGGQSPPRLSMARPMRASVERNPNAIRVSRRSRVLTDSTRALEAPCSRLATIVCR
jgi:hypothetical protein